MNNKPIFLLLTILMCCFSQIRSQEVVMNLGGAAHNNVYNTKPLKKFGKVRWKTDLQGNGCENFIEHNGILYLSSTFVNRDARKINGHIFAIRLADGSKIWENTVYQNISSPTLAGNTLFYGSDDVKGKQFAVDANTGKILWTFDTRLASCWPPAVVGNKNYFGSHGDTWYVVDHQTSVLLCEREVPGGICCRPAVADSVIYFTDTKGILHACNIKTDEDIWTFDSGAGTNNAPAIADDVAYMINKEGNIFAVDCKTGKLIWTFKTDDTMFRSPAVSNGVATVITSNGHIYAFNSEKGTVLWELRKSGLGYTNPAIAGEIVYVGCGDNHLYALDLKTGKEIWNFDAGAPVNTPYINSGTVYFTSGRYVYALQ